MIKGINIKQYYLQSSTFNISLLSTTINNKKMTLHVHNIKVSVLFLDPLFKLNILTLNHLMRIQI